MTWLRSALRSPRALVGLVLVAGMIALAATLAVIPKTYEAQATLAVVRNPAVPGSVTSLDRVRLRLAEMAESPALLDQVSAKIHADPRRRDLAGEVTGEAPRDLPIVVITARDSDRRVAVEIAQTVADLLVERAPRDAAERVAVVAPATTPRMFSEPSLAPWLGVGLAGILLLMALIGQARSRARDTLSSLMDLENAAAAPMLGHLLAPLDLTVLPVLNHDSDIARRFTTLARSLLGRRRSAARETIVVVGVLGQTSRSSTELHVWVGANLAASLAMEGHSTLLVDGRIGDLFGVPTGPEPGAPGLADVLDGVGVDQAAIPGPVDGMWVLPAGATDRGSGARRSGTGAALTDKVSGTLAAIAEEFDAVVLLAPETGTEARAFSVQQRVLLVVPDHGLRAAELQDETARIRRAGGRILGLVVVGQSRRA